MPNTIPDTDKLEATLKKAKNGEIAAQMDMAWWYLKGLGLEQNSQEAFYWYQQAANSGDALGQYMLAKRYSRGDGVDQNYEKAFFWFQKAHVADPEDPYALFEIAKAYFQGLGIDKDLEKAACFFQKAAKNGTHLRALYFYGFCIFNGYGIYQDKEEGLKLIKKAAESGEKEAQGFLAEFEKGPNKFKNAMMELDGLIGIEDVKHEVKRLMDRIELYQLRKEHNLISKKPDLHLVFLGNPGTGKTTVARILGAILNGISLLEQGHVVEVGHAELVSSYIGQTPIQVKEQVTKALGGILFIDEAYTLMDNNDAVGPGRVSEAISTLLKLMDEYRDNLVVIAAGSKKEMNNFLKVNPGFSSRFTNFIEFKDFSAEELVRIYECFCMKEGYHLTENSKIKLEKLIADILSTKLDHFGNARVMRNIFRETIMNLASRVAKIENKTKDQLVNILEEDIPYRDNLNYLLKGQYKRLSYEKALGEIEKMIGLNKVKSEISNFINRILLKKNREKQGLVDSGFNVYLIFTGSPGTGKTTVARLLGDVLRGIGVLKMGHVVEVSQVDLIAGYIGQTAGKVQKKVEEALGGILFIDEAYGLTRQASSGNDYGADAVNTLMKMMEDHRDEFVVIMAGYKDEMKEFLKMNPGLSSRFTNIIEFEDYTEEELMEVYLSFCEKESYKITEEAKDNLSRLIQKVLSEKHARDKKHFGNGRFMRLIYRATLINLANRIAKFDNLDKEILQLIIDEDIPKFEDIEFLDEKKRIGFN